MRPGTLHAEPSRTRMHDAGTHWSDASSASAMNLWPARLRRRTLQGWLVAQHGSLAEDGGQQLGNETGTYVRRSVLSCPFFRIMYCVSSSGTCECRSVKGGIPQGSASFQAVRLTNVGCSSSRSKSSSVPSGSEAIALCLIRCGP